MVQVSGPAGSGKTSLIRAWIAEENLSNNTAWVTVGIEDRDPRRFWLSVLEAVRQTSSGSALVGDLTAAPGLDAGTIVERLLGDLSALDDRIWLVLDDLHEQRSAEALRQLELFVMRAPCDLRLVFVTRGDLRLGLHRLRVDGQLTEIRGGDLRFSLEETHALFKGAGVELSEAALALLAARTEGWAAGLRLAALSLAGDEDPERLAADFAGSERTVAEYLLAEVLERQPEEVRQLLLRTSMLERVSGPLADALTGGCDGQRILQELEESGAFVVALDLRRSWFRYHHLFADLLQLELQRISADSVRSLHATASVWFMQHGHPVEAIRHAQAAELWDAAARLLSDHWFAFVLGGKGATAHELLDGFHSVALDAIPELNALMSLRDLDRGSASEAARRLQLAAQAIESVAAERRGHLELVLAIARLSLARHRGDLAAVAEHARVLLTPAEEPGGVLGGLDDEVRAFAVLEFGVAELWTGDLEAAVLHLEQALNLGRRVERPFVVLGALAHLAQIEIFDSVPLGIARSDEAIALAKHHGWADDPLAGVAYAVNGIAHVVQGNLSTAEAQLQQAERTRLAWVSPAGGLMLYVMRGLLEAARGRNAEALAAFRSAEQLGESLVGSHLLAARIPGHLVRTLVALGATERAEAVLARLDDSQRALPEIRISAAALRLAHQDPEGAASQLAPLLGDRALAMRPQVWPVQALLLEAIIGDVLGDLRRSESALERALDLAEPDGLLVPFLLYPATHLLERHRRHHRTAHSAMVAEILDLLSSGSRIPPPTGELSLGPLTESEMRVLRYLPTNLSAPEIAAQLGVSLNTIRTHTRHLYAKLGVHTRTGAVERARALRLLAPSSRRPQ